MGRAASTSIPGLGLDASWPLLSALYEQAIELDTQDRAEFVARLQAQGHPQAPGLLRLLDARQRAQAEDFLAALPRMPGLAAALTDVTDVMVGRRYGAWRLRQPLGAGGMAEVWLAERDDGVLCRRAALKLMHRHASAGRRASLEQRFARERDILTRLHHPNIATLYDAGVSDDGQPWLALEFVEGEPIDIGCDRRQLGIAERVRHFVQVLNAVQHAHGHLVMHRDLKPANILLTDDGQVRLLDFGIAKFADAEGQPRGETALTQAEGRPMTPAHASPEQLLGQPLSVSCDVYALGIVLYGLLTGVHPFAAAGQTAAQTEARILESMPLPPSAAAIGAEQARARSTTLKALRRQLAGDLDAIVLQALRRLPQNRYASAQALLDDLDCWLKQQPVRARAPRLGYLAQRFVARHRVGVALGSLALGGLVALAVTATVMGWRAREESARAVAARDFMLDIFRRADPEQARGATISAGELLETGRREALTRLADQPRLQSELLSGIAATQGYLGQHLGAVQTLDAVRKLQQGLGDSAGVQATTLQLAEAASRADDFDRAAAELRTLRKLARPSDHHLLSQILLLESDADLASQDWAAAREHCAQSYAQGDGAVQLQLDALRCLARVASLLGRGEESRRLYGALDLLTPALPPPGLPPRPRAGIAFEHGDALLTQGLAREADEVLTAAQVACQRDIGRHALDCRSLLTLKLLARLRMEQFDGLEADLEELRALSTLTQSPFDAGSATEKLARFESARQNLQALPALTHRLEAMLASPPEGNVSPGMKRRAALALIEVALRTGAAAEAERRARDVLAADTGLRGESAGRVHAMLGMALLQRQAVPEALQAYDAAARAYAQTMSDQHPKVLLLNLNRAVALAASKQYDEAEHLVMAALPGLDNALGPRAPGLARMRTLASALHDRSLDTRHPPFFN